MGGKVWSDTEERTFWDTIVPQSPNAANPADRNLSWKECAVLMQQTLGEDARRNYTSTMLYEHHYQNWKPGPKTPRAHRFMAKYIRDCEWYEIHTTTPPPSPSIVVASAASATPAAIDPATRPGPTSAPARVAIPRLKPRTKVSSVQSSAPFHSTLDCPNTAQPSIPNGEHQRRSLPTAPRPTPHNYIMNTPAPSYWPSQHPTRCQQESTAAASQENLTRSTWRGPLPIDPALRSGVVINHILSSSEYDTGEPIPVLQYFVSDTGELRSSPAPSRASTESTGDSLASECTRTTPNNCRSSAPSSASEYSYARADRSHPLSMAARHSGHGNVYASIQGKRKRSGSGTPEEERPYTRPFSFMHGGRSILNESEAASALQSLNGAVYQYPIQPSPQSARPDAEAQQKHHEDVPENES